MSARRAALVAALVLGVALAIVIVARTPWTVLPVPPGGRTPLDPTGGLSAAQVNRAESFARLLRPTSLFSLALGLAVAAVLGLTPLGGRLVRAVAAPFGGGWVWQVLLGVLVLSVIGRLITLPIAAYAEVVRHRYGLSTRGWGLWLRDVSRLHRDQRRPDRRGPAGPGLPRPPGAADVVDLGGPGGGGAGGRRVVPVAGAHRARLQPLRPDAGRAAAHRPAGPRGAERHPGAGRAHLRREPADDGAERLRLRLRLHPADRRLRHGAGPAARRPDRVDRGARARPRLGGRRPHGHPDGRPRGRGRRGGARLAGVVARRCSSGRARTRRAIRGSSRSSCS